MYSCSLNARKGLQAFCLEVIIDTQMYYQPLVKIHLGIFTRGARRKIMKLIDVETVYGTFAPNVRYTGNEIMALLMQQPEAYNIENVITAIKNRSEDYNAGVRLHGKPQTMLTDDAVYIVENGYTL